MKLCKDCKYHWPRSYDWCNYPDPPVGHPNAKTCQDERKETGSCGVDGKHFKPTLVYRFKSWFGLLPLLLIALVLVGCGSQDKDTSNRVLYSGWYDVYEYTIQGHSYIVVSGSGKSIIHAEHCQCKRNDE